MSEQLKLFNVDTEIYRISSTKGAVPFVDEVEEFINSLSTEHLDKINEFFDTMPKLTHAIKVKNPNTKKTGEVLIEGIQSFFD